MMDKLRTAPLPLRRKLLLTALAGAAFFLVGLAAIFFSLDTVTALLSGILAIGLAFKTAELYRLIIAGHYSTVDGICIAITQTPLRKYRNIRIIDSQERERTLVLPRQDKDRGWPPISFLFQSLCTQISCTGTDRQQLHRRISPDRWLSWA